MVLGVLPATLTALSAFAVFVLVLGWSITPAQANKPDEFDQHDHGDGGVGGPATLNFGRRLLTVDRVPLLEGGMDYPVDNRGTMNPLPEFTVQVDTDSPKKLWFNNYEFDISDSNNSDIDGIMMDFDINPEFCTDKPNCGSCVTQALPSGHNAAEEELQANGPDLLEAMANELNIADITSGSLNVQIDKKRDTAALGFQYTSTNSDLSVLGRTSIQLTGIFGSPSTPTFVEDPLNTFSYFGGRVVVLQGISGPQSNPIIGCDVRKFDGGGNPLDVPDVVLILNR